MALQRINWTQIETENVPSGSIIDIGSASGSINAGYFDNLYISGTSVVDLINAGSGGTGGVAGTSGTSGTSGASGTSGTSGSSGISGDKYRTISNTNLSISTGTKILTVEPNLGYSIAQQVILVNDTTRYMEGVVESYNSGNGSMTVTVTSVLGSGSYSYWIVNLAGAAGGDGSSGTSGTSGSSGTAGTSGSSGTSGTSGSSGTSGTSGSSGTAGTSGTSGSSGTAGTSGTSGSSGTAGTSGTSGSSGTSGQEGHFAKWVFRANDNTSTNPGDNNFRFNTLSWGVSPSQIAINDKPLDLGGTSINTYLDSIQIGTILKIVKLTDATVYKFLRITQVTPYQAGWETYEVIQIASAGSDPSDGDVFTITPIGIPGALTLSGTTDNGIITLNGEAPYATVESNMTFDGSNLNITGSVNILGDLNVKGTTTLVQVNDPNTESLIVSGAMKLVQNQISGQIVSASIKLQDIILARYNQEGMNGMTVIDCGDGFF